MNPVLNRTEARVLGALIEKEITTPDYYPLSLNALVNACNQKSNRDPVMSLEEDVVRDALYSLQEKRLAAPRSTADSRVPKYEHRLQEVFNLTRGETAVLCVLLLRGAQTPGELRGRTERMFEFAELSEVPSVLQRMMQRDPPLVAVLARQPGTKESRYAHLLSGELEEPRKPGLDRGTQGGEAASAPAEAARMAQLEAEINNLKSEFAALREQFAEFRKQFE